MITRTKNIKSLAYQMNRRERLRGRIIAQSATVKLNRSPFQVYTRQKAPKEGVEVLYAEGQNNGKAIVNPNGFPWVNLRLDPLGKIMRKDQHHTILDSGYDRLISILEYLITKYGEESQTMMNLRGEKRWETHDCWVIEFTNPNFQIVSYQVKPGETVQSIADGRHINAYMILELNNHVDHYNDISPGQIISLPSDYCQQMELYIDKKRRVPLRFSILDHLGLYEQYEFSNLRIDPDFTSEEFSESFHNYDF
ncbi:MAG: DUF1571 domain-containing protein [Saprospiraceae bacterium]|nr:DUF1571 domain-containing protein [Saprospiraceae bacterium]